MHCKLAAFARLTLYFNSAAMKLYERFGKGKPYARSIRMYFINLIETVENIAKILYGNTLPGIFY